MAIRPVSEQEWQARDDARTLMNAELIKNDTARLLKAQEVAKRLAEEQNKEASLLNKIAGKGQQKESPNKALNNPQMSPKIKQNAQVVSSFGNFKKII